MNDKTNLTIKELIKLAHERPMTEDDVKAFEERCRQRAKEFKEWEDSHKITKEFLDREYTI